MEIQGARVHNIHVPHLLSIYASTKTNLLRCRYVCFSLKITNRSVERKTNKDNIV